MKCKLNDLCFVIKSRVPSNIGKVVTCKQYLGYYTKGAQVVDGLCFVVEQSAHFWMVEGNVTDYGGRNLGYGVSSEYQLLPIPTEPIEDSEISSRELEFN